MGRQRRGAEEREGGRPVSRMKAVETASRVRVMEENFLSLVETWSETETERGGERQRGGGRQTCEQDEGGGDGQQSEGHGGEPPLSGRDLGRALTPGQAGPGGPDRLQHRPDQHRVAQQKNGEREKGGRQQVHPHPHVEEVGDVAVMHQFTCNGEREH